MKILSKHFLRTFNEPCTGDKLPWECYRYWGFDKGFYNFSKQIRGGYLNILVSEENLLDGSYLFMFKHDLSNDPDSECKLF